MKTKNLAVAQYHNVPMPEVDHLVIVSIEDYQKSSSASANEIHIWCTDVNIKAELLGSHSFETMENMKMVWKVPSEKHRLLFSLKWGAE